MVGTLMAAALAVLSACSTGAGGAPAADDSPTANHSPAAGQSSGADGSRRHEASGATVIQPGRPGETARTLPPDATLPANRHNGADVRFVQMMIPHHAQALRMSRLARTRATDPQVQEMADRIFDAQGPEILRMSSWLERHGIDAPTAEDLKEQRHHSAHMQPMPGMLSEARMHQLAAADGRRFDRLFLRLMVQHHQGAVQMAHQVLDRGRNLVIDELATEIAAGQTAEIDRMRDLLRRL